MTLPWTAETLPWTAEQIEAEIAARMLRRIEQLYPETGLRRRELYGKHLEFFAFGAGDKDVTEKAAFGGNRVGKTVIGAFEMTCHLTGIYPAWWPGRRFGHPVDAWACGVNNLSTRDVVQTELLGKLMREPGDRPEQIIGLGTGMIPHRLLRSVAPRVGLPGSMEGVWVTHANGGVSTLGFKSYEQGWRTFQGTSKHVIWLDEEPEQPIYTECMMRLLTTCGILLFTATPLLGMSDVVRGYFE